MSFQFCPATATMRTLNLQTTQLLQSWQQYSLAPDTSMSNCHKYVFVFIITGSPITICETENTAMRNLGADSAVLGMRHRNFQITVHPACWAPTGRIKGVKTLEMSVFHLIQMSGLCTPEQFQDMRSRVQHTGHAVLWRAIDSQAQGPYKRYKF